MLSDVGAYLHKFQFYHQTILIYCYVPNAAVIDYFKQGRFPRQKNIERMFLRWATGLKIMKLKKSLSNHLCERDKNNHYSDGEARGLRAIQEP